MSVSGDLISVVIPTHNYARFLPRALDSVLAQTHSRLEIIVVDDGSTDGTDKVLARYGARLRVLAGPGRGPSASRNVGIGAANGDFIAVLDADDEWRPTKLARQLAVLVEEPRLGAVGCAVEMRTADGPLGIRYFYNPSDERLTRMRAVALRRDWVGGSNSGALMPRRVVELLGGYTEELPAAEDWFMWLRLADRWPIRNVHEILATIHLHGTGTFRNPALMLTAQNAAHALARATWPEVFDEATDRQLEAMIARDAAGELCLQKQWSDATVSYARSLVAWPRQPAVWRLLAKATARAALTKVRSDAAAPR
jgi:GT2 family glycosyltransferase